MDLANHVEDIRELLLHLLHISLLFLLIDDADTSFEVTDNFLVSYFARLVNLVIREDGEPGLGEATSLTTLDWDANEGLVGVREQLTIVLKLVFVELAVVKIGHLCDAGFLNEFILGSVQHLLIGFARVRHA